MVDGIHTYNDCGLLILVIVLLHQSIHITMDTFVWSVKLYHIPRAIALSGQFADPHNPTNATGYTSGEHKHKHK